MIYLDHAATTPIPRIVADEMYRVLTEQYGNPSAQYPLGQTAHALVERYRKTMASAVGCQSEQLFFTSCGTESDNWAISAALWQNRHVGKHIITTAVEHSAVLEPCKWWERQGGTVTYLSPDRDGMISVQQVLDALRPDTALVSIMMVNNELGTVYPVHEIAEAVHRQNPKTIVHTDAVQGFLHVPFTTKSLDVDLLSLSAHKIGGPKGIGALYIGERVRNPKPLLAGGGQESALRSGTEATAQIAGFAKATELRASHLDEDLSHLAEINEYARSQLSSIPDLVWVGVGTAPHILSFSLSGYPSQNVVNDLAAQDICLSAGSACHKGKPSHVIATLQLPKRVSAGVLRISFGPETTKTDIDTFTQALRTHHDTRFPML